MLDKVLTNFAVMITNSVDITWTKRESFTGGNNAVRFARADLFIRSNHSTGTETNEISPMIALVSI